MTDQPPMTAAAAGTIGIGGDLTVNRLGYGAMQITGKGVWGEPTNRGAVPTRGRSRWPGCWPAPPLCCRSPAPTRSRTWSTTSPRPAFG
jgi:hypothetical protein